MNAVRRVQPYLVRDGACLANLGAPGALRAELARPSTRPARVAIGWGADPYNPLEGDVRLMPRLLAILADYAIPTMILTHSPLIERDIEPLARLARAAGVRVSFRVASIDDVRVAARLARSGIDVDAALLHAIGHTLDAAILRARIVPEAPRQLRLNIAV